MSRSAWSGTEALMCMKPVLYFVFALEVSIVANLSDEELRHVCIRGLLLVQILVEVLIVLSLALVLALVLVLLYYAQISFAYRVLLFLSPDQNEAKVSAHAEALVKTAWYSYICLLGVCIGANFSDEAQRKVCIVGLLLFLVLMLATLYHALVRLFEGVRELLLMIYGDDDEDEDDGDEDENGDGDDAIADVIFDGVRLLGRQQPHLRACIPSKCAEWLSTAVYLLKK
eukprot:gb/GECG01006304.1/.p1 GENE.gb/GECG01006304.1/~~gb/GECG01006304.1/.p1  ORF type:complete len:228 (+),score=21.51 gb/GECG01006304.1/:1-684(+)